MSDLLQYLFMAFVVLVESVPLTTLGLFVLVTIGLFLALIYAVGTVTIGPLRGGIIYRSPRKK